MENNKNIFSTDSFVLASYLLCESLKLTSINMDNPKRMIFVFEDSTQRKPLIELFFSYKAQVEPNRFYSAQRNLKQMIYQNK